VRFAPGYDGNIDSLLTEMIDRFANANGRILLGLLQNFLAITVTDVFGIDDTPRKGTAHQLLIDSPSNSQRSPLVVVAIFWIQIGAKWYRVVRRQGTDRHRFRRSARTLETFEDIGRAFSPNVGSPLFC
jgi:hypothetical protein